MDALFVWLFGVLEPSSTNSQNWSRKGLKIMFIKSINVVGALVRSNDITRNL